MSANSTAQRRMRPVSPGRVGAWGMLWPRGADEPIIQGAGEDRRDKWLRRIALATGMGAVPVQASAGCSFLPGVLAPGAAKRWWLAISAG